MWSKNGYTSLGIGGVDECFEERETNDTSCDDDRHPPSCAAVYMDVFQ